MVSSLLFLVAFVMLENPVSSLQIGRIKTDVALLPKKTRKNTMSAGEASCEVGLWYYAIILARVKSGGAASGGFIIGLYRCPPALKHSEAISSVFILTRRTVQRLPMQSPDGSRCVPAPHNAGYPHSFLQAGFKAESCLLSNVNLIWQSLGNGRERQRAPGAASAGQPEQPR